MKEKVKKEKVILTPEQKAERKAMRKQTAWLGFKEGIIPFFIQMAILVVVILFFVFVIANDAIPDVAGVPQRNDEANDPNIVRLIYMILTIPATILLVRWAVKTENKKKAFWIGLIAGIVAWQGIGECSWHFGLPFYGWTNWPTTGAVYETFVFFPKIEGVQGTFLLVLFVPLLLYMFRKGDFSWGLRIFVLSFFCNWVGHWVILGIAPMWPAALSYHNPYKWPKIVGILAGLHGTLMLIYKILFKAKTTEERYVLSLLLYTFVGVLVEGVFQVGGALE